MLSKFFWISVIGAVICHCVTEGFWGGGEMSWVMKGIKPNNGVANILN